MSGFVYFIRPKGQVGPIKIGHSIDPRARLESLMCWSPVELEIVATAVGSRDLEYQLHCCFADLHWRKEWFLPDGRLLAAIERISTGDPVEAVVDLADVRGDIRREHYQRRSQLTAARRARGIPKITYGAPPPGPAA